MTDHEWIKEFPATIIVCDPNGVILALNDRAASHYEKDGGYALIGCNLLDCHPDPARSKVEAMLAARENNIYTIEKAGVKKFVHQSPWYQQGEYAGFVEMVFEIPWEMPHFVRS